MYRYVLISKLLILSLSLSLIIFSSFARAATMSIDQMALGKIIAVNGQKFVKIRQDAEKGSQFQAMNAACLPNTTPYFTGTMQEFDAAACNNIPTPSGTCYVFVGTLTDSRDGKSYEVRKFADGKCWMVDNLMYGGATDNCAGVDAAGYTNATYGGADGMASPSNRFGTGTYGNCRDPRVGVASPCTAGSAVCGYAYNWQAAMQHPSAYWGTNYTGSTTNVQGICPAGWHVPTATFTGEFRTLYVVTGSSATEFWRPGENYKSVYSGYVGSNGALNNQGAGMRQWSASERAISEVLFLHVSDSIVTPNAVNFNKNLGYTVRCIKDTTERTMQSFTTADCDAYPTPSGTNYTPIGQLKDERDGKWYEIRKFADGRCWMVDNLAYGGATDACAAKTTFSGNGSATPTNTFGAGTYGDCRNNSGDSTYGYLYNWQAAMQHSSAYYMNDYTGPTNNVQGICPSGWHIPTGNTTGEYQALHTAVSSNVAFWQNTGSWKGVFSGLCYNSGSLNFQGSRGFYWSSTQGGTGNAHSLNFLSSDVYPGTGDGNKYYGFTVRCIKN